VLVNMPRDQLLEWARKISVGHEQPAPVREALPNLTVMRDILGALAVSYGRRNDLCMTAALARAAACFGLSGGSLLWAEGYLLDQQAPEGFFGFLALERVTAGLPADDIGPVIRLTVEVIWTLAAIEAVERRRMP
jgi:hypothetical protein